jgi:hypothetical protein
VNQVDARVHRVAEGLLLVSPGLFKDFQAATGVRWEQAQKRFQRLKLHRKTPQGTNIHTYIVAGKRRTGRIKGFLVPDIDAVLPNLDAPSPNPYLRRAEVERA